MVNKDFLLGFEDFSGKEEKLNLSIQGSIPAWLKGSYIRNGMGQYQVGSDKLRHWFDGYALLAKFHFETSQVYYQTRFIQSQHYQSAKKSEKILYGEFGTASQSSILKRLLMGSDQLGTDNTNVNILPCNQKLLAMTETPKFQLIDPDDLSTIGKVIYPDDHKFSLTLAHPHFDRASQQMINIGLGFGKQNYYHIYRMDLHSFKREIIASIPCQNPGYQHSFSITERYIILIDQAFRLNPMKLLWNTYFGHKAYCENYVWEPESYNYFYIIEKSTGKLIQKLQTDPFFIFHTINAFEDGKNIILDAHIYQNADLVKQLYLEELAEIPELERSQTCRFTLSLSGENLDKKVLDNTHWEFGRIDYEKLNGRPYRYFFGTNASDAVFSNQIFKYDHETGGSQYWKEKNTYVGEPLFIPKPQASAADEGIVLSVALDTEKKQSFLLLLNAKDFTEFARIYLPHVLPFGLHGNFISA